MADRCKYCNVALHPKGIITAYKGALYCSRDCCISDVAYDLINKEHSMMTCTTLNEIKAKARKQVDDCAEEVLGADIGIPAPLCPFNSGFCDGKCALDINGRCAIAIIATNK